MAALPSGRFLAVSVMSRPRQPAGLGPAGKGLWRSLVDVYLLDPREVAQLSAACRQADDVALLEAELANDGVIVTGSKGQPRLSGVVAELRQGRLAVSRLLGDLALPDLDQKPMTARSARAKKAADFRWTRVRSLGERRGEATA